MATFRIVLSITMISRLRQSVARVNHRRAWIRSSMACCSAAVIVPDDIVCCSCSLCAARTSCTGPSSDTKPFRIESRQPAGASQSRGDDIRHTGRDHWRRQGRSATAARHGWRVPCALRTSGHADERVTRTSDDGPCRWTQRRGRDAFFRPPEGFAAFLALAPLAFTERRLGARRPPPRWALTLASSASIRSMTLALGSSSSASTVTSLPLALAAIRSRSCSV